MTDSSEDASLLFRWSTLPRYDFLSLFFHFSSSNIACQVRELSRLANRVENLPPQLNLVKMSLKEFVEWKNVLEHIEEIDNALSIFVAGRGQEFSLPQLKRAIQSVTGVRANDDHLAILLAVFDEDGNGTLVSTGSFVLSFFLIFFGSLGQNLATCCERPPLWVWPSRATLDWCASAHVASDASKSACRKHKQTGKKVKMDHFKNALRCSSAGTAMATTSLASFKTYLPGAASTTKGVSSNELTNPRTNALSGRAT